MKNTKGFTLIELLAVIVVLAIIALIASPIIIGLIDDARKEAAADSAYGVYHAVENVYAKVSVANPAKMPGAIYYTFGTGGTITIGYGATGTTTLPGTWNITVADATLDFTGTKPTGGVLTLNANGSVTIGTSLVIDGFTCTKTGETFSCS